MFVIVRFNRSLGMFLRPVSWFEVILCSLATHWDGTTCPVVLDISICSWFAI